MIRRLASSVSSRTTSPNYLSLFILFWWQYYTIEQSNSYISMGICIFYFWTASMDDAELFHTSNEVLLIPIRVVLLKWHLRQYSALRLLQQKLLNYRIRLIFVQSLVQKVRGRYFTYFLHQGRDDFKTQIGIPHSEVIMLIPSLLSFSLVWPSYTLHYCRCFEVHVHLLTWLGN